MKLLRPSHLKHKLWKRTLYDLPDKPPPRKIEKDNTINLMKPEQAEFLPGEEKTKTNLARMVTFARRILNVGGMHRNYTFAQVSAEMREYRYTDALRVIYHSYKNHTLIERQNYSPEIIEELGFDLGAAHFLLSLGASVKFVGEDNYRHGYGILRSTLPEKYDSTYKIEAIKLNNVELLDNGYKALRHLYKLKHFDASDNPFFNDAQLDRVFAQFGTTLESIDVSRCFNMTSNGLTALARFRKLKQVKVEGMDHVDSIEFICLLLEEATENIQIEGIIYLEPEAEKKKTLLDDVSKDVAHDV